MQMQCFDILDIILIRAPRCRSCMGKPHKLTSLPGHSRGVVFNAGANCSTHVHLSTESWGFFLRAVVPLRYERRKPSCFFQFFN